MYNKTTIVQLHTCTVKIEYSNKYKMCKIFVVLGNRQPLLGMSDMDVPSIINIVVEAMIIAAQTRWLPRVQK